MDKNPLGSKMAPKALIIIHYVERGKPYMFLFITKGMKLVRVTKDIEGRGKDKKRKVLL